MRYPLRRLCAHAVITLALGIASIGVSTKSHAQAAVYRFDMPAQSLAEALKALGRQTSKNILFDPDLVEGVTAPALQAELSVGEAMQRLLSGTQLSFESISADTVLLQKNSTAAAGVFKTPEVILGRDEVRLAQSETSSSQKDEQGENRKESSITEIIVTAQKREEHLEDVPVPVTVISADSLVSSNLMRIQDYSTRIPGFSVGTLAYASQQVLAIRGITTGGGNPTVGVVVDDVPYGGSTFNGGGTFVPDLDPSELARIEVLRGPQGTLYGASSMGGLLKYVTVDPSTERVSAHFQAGITSVRNGNETGHSLRGAINVPLGDTVAMRASAFTRLDPGYIDNPVLGIEGVNRASVDGGRLSAMWRPSSSFSAKLSASLQRSKQDGLSYVSVSPNLGDLKQAFPVRGVGGNDLKSQIYSVILAAKLGSADLVSLSGYNINSGSLSYDTTRFVGAAATQAQFGVTGDQFFGDQKTRKFTQEIRLSLPINQQIDLLLGAFYTDESNSWHQRIYAVDPPTARVAGQWLDNVFPTTYKEYAGFANLTFKFTERFDIQIGGRESQNRQSYEQTEIGPYIPLFNGVPSPLVIPEVHSKANSFTYLLTPRFKVSSDLMAYMRLASGYRAGGPNSATGVAPQYDPDKTKSYEVGVKGDALGGALSFEISLYYIDWKDIQLTLFASGNSYQANGGAAKSQGIELSAETHPLNGMTVSVWAAWNDAELTEALPPTSTAFGAPGARLPFSSRFSGNFSLDQDFVLTSSIVGFIGSTVTYVGDRLRPFRARSDQLRQLLPAYSKIDLRAGVKSDDWTVNLFINNVADKRAVAEGSFGSASTDTFIHIQPRTLGVSLSRNF